MRRTIRAFALSLCVMAFGDTSALAQQNDAVAAPQDCADSQLCIGVRSYARPFAYRPGNLNEVASDAPRGPLRAAGYTGYMVKICDAALAEMTLDTGNGKPLTKSDIGIFDIDLDREERHRRSGCALDPVAEDAICPVPVRRFTEGLGRQFDVLCDPATISNDRRDNGYTISPPLFLTGIAYLSQRGIDGPGDPCSNLYTEGLIGVVGGTNAGARGVRALVDFDELPKYREELIAYLRTRQPCGEDSANGASSPGNSGFRMIRSYNTHMDAAQAFCEKSVHYYLGDLEIITENVRSVPGCEYRVSPTTYTNDRYGVFGKSRRDDDGELDPQETRRALLVAQFFQILAQKTVVNPSILDKAFSDTFQNANPSRKLELFLWSIRGAHE